MVDIDKAASNKISNLGFVSACLVVLIHCPKTSGVGIQFFHEFIPGFLTYVPVAFFFMVSGFFLCLKFRTRKGSWWNCYRAELAKRWRSLMIPYLVLNLLWLGCVLAYQWPNIRMGDHDVAHPFVWFDLLRALGFGGERYPIDGPLWFVRSLFLFAMFVPVCFSILCRKSIAYVAVTALFILNCFSWDWVGCPAVLETVCPEWMMFFLLGAVFATHGIPRVGRCKGCALLFVGVLMAFVARGGCFQDGIVLRGLSQLTRFVLIAGCWGLVPDVAWPKVLTGNAFPVFALHWPLVMISYIVTEKMGVYTVMFGNWVFAILYMAVVISLTIISAMVIRRVRWLERYMLGGR